MKEVHIWEQGCVVKMLHKSVVLGVVVIQHKEESQKNVTHNYGSYSCIILCTYVVMCLCASFELFTDHVYRQ